jgi:predicted phage tail protein
VIPIADELLAGRPVGGRISAVNGKVITLDRDTQAKPGDRLILNLPDGKCEGRTVQLVSGRQITVTVSYSVAPEPELVWALDADDLAIPLYRVVSVARPEPGVFEISAVQYDPSKFAHIDTGARLEERPISVIPITVVPAPASVDITSNYSVDQGLAISTMNISWPTVNGAVAYDVEWRKDSGNWIKLQRTGSTSVDVTGIYSGAYLARVRSVSAFEISSIWKSSSLTDLEGKTGLPPAVSSLTTTSLIYGIGIQWAFPPGAEDTQRTELWYSQSADLTTAIKLSDFSYPQAKHEMHSLLAGASLYFWARLVDRTGNVGPFFPVPGAVNGRASSDQTEYDKYFADKIGKGALYQSLRAEINLISGDGPGSVNERLEHAKQELEDLIAEVSDALEYVPTKTYVKGDIVRTGQRLSQATKDVPAGKAPPDANFWFDLGTIAETTSAMALQIQQNKTAIEEVDGWVTATAQRLEGVYASVETDSAGSEEGSAGDETSSAGAWSLMSAIAERDFAQSTRTDIVEAKVAANTASITTVQNTVATDKAATAEQINTLKTSAGQNSAAIQVVSKAQASLNGKVSSMVTFKAETISGGKKVASGFAFGSDGEQSEFLIFAQRFAVVDEVSGQLVPMFVVQNNQVFLNQAIINIAFIQQIILGMNLRSESVDSKGRPLLEINVKTGTFVLRGEGTDGSILLDNTGIAAFDANEKRRGKFGRISNV